MFTNNQHQFRQTLVRGSHSDRLAAAAGAPDNWFTDEVFEQLWILLKDEEKLTRFFALDTVIKKFPEKLEELSEERIDDLYQMLLDTSGPVIGRAMWAIDIARAKSVDYLIVKYSKEEIEGQRRIIQAIARGKFEFRTEDRVKILLSALQSENDDLRFEALSGLMINSPNSPWCEKKKTAFSNLEFNWDQVHKEAKRVAERFMGHSDDTYRNLSKRYFDWLRE